MNEPSPAAADSRPNSRAPAPNVCSASSGTSTCHSKTKVKIRAMISRGRRRSSVAQTYFRPAFRCPFCRVVRRCACSSEVCIARSAASTARYETPSIRKQTAMPTNAISSPATAGPTIRAPVNAALLRLTAFVSVSSPTIST